MRMASATARLLVQPGDVYVVDPRVLHRGMANQSESPKQTWYFSFEEVGKTPLLGSTNSLLPRYTSKFTLAQLWDADNRRRGEQEQTT